MAIITNLQPPAGEPIASDTVLSFDVIDPVIAELRVFVWVVFRETGQVELANDGDNFQPLYSFSQITTIPGGRRYAIRRVGGWPSTPELRVDDCACPPEIGTPSSGEVNTASNQGGAPGEFFITKVAEDLQFRTAKSSDGSISIITDVDNTVDFTFAGSSLTEPVIDVANVPVLSPGRQDLTLVDGEAGFYAEPPFPPGPKDPLYVAFPPVSSANFGRRVGVVLAAGNGTTPIEWTPDVADAFIDPSYSFNAPGGPTVEPVGTYGPTFLVWQAVEDLAGPGVHGWAFEYGSNLGGGGGGDWASVLAAGNVSGANDASMEDEQRVEWGVEVPAPLDPTSGGSRSARRFDGAAPGAGIWSDMGSAVALDEPSRGDTTVIVRAYCTTQQGNAPNDPKWAVLEEVWNLRAATRLRTILSENPDGAFRFNMTGNDLFLQVNDLNLGGSITAYAMVDVTIQPGPPPA